MDLFTSDLFSSTMCQQHPPRRSRSYREPPFAPRYGRRRPDGAATAIAEPASSLEARRAAANAALTAAASIGHDFDRAA